MAFVAKPVRIVVGTTNIRIYADGALSFTKNQIRQFCGKKLTTFEFNRRIKRYMPDKHYFRFNYERNITIIPASFYKPLIDHLTSNGVEYIEQAASTYPTRKIDVKMNPKFSDQAHQVEPIKHLSTCPDPRRGLQLQTGCLAGDTVINLNRARKGFQLTLVDAYRKFNAIPSAGRYWDQQFVTNCRSLMGDRIGLNGVENISYSGIQPVYRVTLEDGTFLRGTYTHLIMTDNGWEQLGKLTDKLVMQDSLYPVSMKSVYNKVADKHFTVSKYHPYGRPYQDPRWESYRVSYHRAAFDAFQNGLTISEFGQSLQDPILVARMTFLDPEEFDVHHADFDHNNNDPENLVKVTTLEHRKIHLEYDKFNFNQGIPKYSKAISVVYEGDEDTYDITCSGPQNFIGNGIVCHNCGKTYCATKAAVNIGGAFMVVVSGLCEQWVDSIAEQTTAKEDIWVIKGFKSLATLFNSDIKPPIFVCSLETLRAYIQGKDNYEDLPTYQEFLERYGITTKIVDEAHLNLHATAMIDMAGNVPHNIYLTATFGTPNQALKQIFKTFFPNQMLYGTDEYRRYVDVFFYGFNGCVPEPVCMKGRGYSHSCYEQHMLKHVKIKLHWYEHVIIPIINQHYINTPHRGKMKMLIFCRTVDMVLDVVDRCKVEWSDLDVRAYTSDDPDINLVEADIIVSTHKSAGTGSDIANLYCVLNTHSFKADTTAKQLIGRLRVLKCGTTPVYIDLMDLNLKSHIRHWAERSIILKGCGLHYKEYRIR